MSTTIHSRIVRVARIAQRNARSSDEHDVAAALLDELAGVEVVAAGAVNRGTTEAERTPAAVKVEAVAGGPLAADSKFVPGQDVVVSAERPAKPKATR